MRIQRALNEVVSTLLTINVFDKIIDTSIVFLGVLIVFHFLTLPWYASLIPTTIYFIYAMRMQRSKVSLIHVENKFPFLKEELRTAKDNMYIHNEITEALKIDVLNKLKKVNVSSFIDYTNIFHKLIVLTCLSFIIIFLGALNLATINVPGMIGADGLDFSLIRAPLEDLFEEGELEDILGDPEEIQIGNQDLAVKINKVHTEIDIGDVKPPQPRLFLMSFPDEINVEADASFEEEFSRPDREVVQKYFELIRETSS